MNPASATKIFKPPIDFIASRSILYKLQVTRSSILTHSIGHQAPGGSSYELRMVSGEAALPTHVVSPFMCSLLVSLTIGPRFARG